MTIVSISVVSTTTCGIESWVSWALADHEPKKRLVVENNNSSGKCLRKSLIDWLDCFVRVMRLIIF